MSELHQVTVTEEVQKNGELITETRNTLQMDKAEAEVIASTPAYSPAHPDYIDPQANIYVDNGDGTSTLVRREVEVVEEPTPAPDFNSMTVVELQDYAYEHGITLREGKKADLIEQLEASTGEAKQEE